MRSDYERIRGDNIKEYGEGTRHLEFLGKLYSKRTHFIFELLQNAEDAQAKKIWFSLSSDKLEVEHDGREFNEQDVRGLCGVGVGTKAEDLTQIGKFGIGFKSVYAFTSSPKIHSDDEHFRIEHYVRPYPEEPIKPAEGFTTLFMLPFDEPKIAFSEIETALRELEPRTLLFLRHIELIGMKVHGKPIGRMMRDRRKRSGEWVSDVHVEESGNNPDEDWLVFERPVTIKGISGLRVEIAFQFDNTGQIVPITNSPLIAFFPTEKETNLGFLVQGPYRTTPARDNLPDDDESNRFLVQETAQLLIQALEWYRDNGMLNIEVLNALPIEANRFTKPSMFAPIFDSVQSALHENPLLPSFTEPNEKPTFTAGRTAKLARSAELRSLIFGEQLRYLFEAQEKIFWLNDQITIDRTPLLWRYLRDQLNVEEIDPEGFVRRLTPPFLKRQTDGWIAALYGFLRGQRAWIKNLQYLRETGGSWRGAVPFMERAIIRLGNGRHVVPFQDDVGQQPTAYLPGVATNLPTVKQAVAADKEALGFLKAIGYSQPETTDWVVERVLPKYQASSDDIPPTYDEDLKAIKQSLLTDSESKKTRLQESLAETFWVLAENAATKRRGLRKPSEVYQRSDELVEYFSGNNAAWFLTSELAELFEELKLLGTSEQVRVCYRNPDRAGHVTIQDLHSYHKRGLHGFDPDAEIDGFEHALVNPTLNKCRYIWNKLLLLHYHLIKGTVEFSRRQDFCQSKKREVLSKVGKTATDCKWLPDRDGVFHRPSDLALNDLPDGFELDEELAERLGMRLPETQEAVDKVLEDFGVSREDIEFLKHNRDDFEKFKKLQESQMMPKWPSAESSNPERRARKVAEAARNADPVTRESRSRRVRTNWDHKANARANLKELYTNEDDQMICQICGYEMPFKLEDDSPYFEAVEFVKGFKRELPQNHLALCPVCAAKYRHAKKENSEEIRTSILNISKPEIPVTLAGTPSNIWFVKIHLDDLKTALRTIE